MYQTYIIYSRSTDRYYTGYTGVGVQQRVRRHNNGDTPSTKAGIPWEIKYYKNFSLKKEAIKWENHIKRQKSRAFIKKLIQPDENELKR